MACGGDVWTLTATSWHLSLSLALWLSLSFTTRLLQLLQEEMTSFQPVYESFIQSGLSVLDKSDLNSPDADHVNREIEVINKGWDKLQERLGEREATLHDVLGCSTTYYDTLQKLADWIPDVTDQLESMPEVRLQPETIARQWQQLTVSTLSSTARQWHQLTVSTLSSTARQWQQLTVSTLSSTARQCQQPFHNYFVWLFYCHKWLLYF